MMSSSALAPAFPAPTREIFIFEDNNSFGAAEAIPERFGAQFFLNRRGTRPPIGRRICILAPAPPGSYSRRVPTSLALS